jgi:hypothetical protein
MRKSRAAADEDAHDHSTPIVPREALPSFPRAILGLPINFHFADGPGKNNQGDVNRDPKDAQLVPSFPDKHGVMYEVDRMASPIITRPLWIDGKWLPAVIILNRNLPSNFHVRLKGKQIKAERGESEGDYRYTNIANDYPANVVSSPSLQNIRPMRRQSSAIDALIDFLTNKENFTQHTI